ncbi:hypothetical protein KBY58_03465 [Cyanobium sp. HWJ4-Hawea]|uniref:hypothetical protein n=1 Tax=Cyanobium sp. HWJ4-Hawea TaxID=2823713 RepID=UPI0020CC8007|nr:hypothetical protein [Cyanobium sp. HWJ4-Hawea]MCP9808490.1 hypothetical protein [Cyanobium sp. HWJ4-Hawea]
MNQVDLASGRAAAQQALIATFIVSSAGCYASFVCVKRISLSGGLRQWIGIAMALYMQAQVLLIHQVGRALDNETENGVMEPIYFQISELTPDVDRSSVNTAQFFDRFLSLVKCK